MQLIFPPEACIQSHHGVYGEYPYVVRVLIDSYPYEDRGRHPYEAGGRHLYGVHGRHPSVPRGTYLGDPCAKSIIGEVM